ncbi:MAG: TolC family protein [Nitrospirota bacterium]
MQYRTMCLIGITSLLGSIWYGESASANRDARVFQLDEVIELALTSNPTLAAAQGTLEQAQGQRVAAGAYLNPSISGSAGRGAIRDPSTGVTITERTITVEQPLEWPGKRAARQRAAEAGLASAYAGLEEARLTVVAEVKVAFYQLLLAQQDADLAKQNLRTVEEVADVVQAKVSTGEAARFEGIKATVEVQKARKEVDRSENALVVAQARLDVLTGKGLGPGFTIRGEFASVRPGLDRQALIARAVERHPVIRRHQKLVEQAASQVVQERASRIPTVSVQGQYHREAGDESLTAGLSVPIPIWYRRQGEIGVALGAQRRAEAERLRVQNELEQTVTQHAQEVQTAQGQIRVFEEGLLKQAKEALDIAQFSFRHGTASLLEVLDAQRVYRQTLLEYAQARADLSIALARLDRAIGELP